MPRLSEKVEQYERLLDEALAAADSVPPPDTPLGRAAEAYTEMAQSYLTDGRHFQAQGDEVNALAAFAYGHGWLDAGARLGLFDVPTDDHLFTV